MRVAVYPVKPYRATRRLSPAEKEMLAAAAGGDPTADQAAAGIEKRRTVARFRVTWRVFDDRSPDGRLKKRSDFDTKGRAQAFADRLRWAGQGVDGWQLDADDQPVQQGLAATARYTVFDLTADYWHAHWPEVSPAQRSKMAGRLRTTRRVLVRGKPTAEALSYLKSVSFHDRTHPAVRALGLCRPTRARSCPLHWHRGRRARAGGGVGQAHGRGYDWLGLALVRRGP